MSKVRGPLFSLLPLPQRVGKEDSALGSGTALAVLSLFPHPARVGGKRHSAAFRSYLPILGLWP